MTRWPRGNPGPVAAKLVEAVQDGQLNTRGQWVAAADTIAALPPSLQKWTIDQITPLLGDDGTQYLLSFASTPRPKYTIEQGARV